MFGKPYPRNHQLAATLWELVKAAAKPPPRDSDDPVHDARMAKRAELGCNLANRRAQQRREQARLAKPGQKLTSAWPKYHARTTDSEHPWDDNAVPMDIPWLDIPKALDVCGTPAVLFEFLRELRGDIDGTLSGIGKTLLVGPEGLRKRTGSDSDSDNDSDGGGEPVEKEDRAEARAMCKAIWEQAHKLKGAAANLYAVSIQRAAFDIECVVEPTGMDIDLPEKVIKAIKPLWMQLEQPVNILRDTVVEQTRCCTVCGPGFSFLLRALPIL